MASRINIVLFKRMLWIMLGAWAVVCIACTSESPPSPHAKDQSATQDAAEDSSDTRPDPPSSTDNEDEEDEGLDTEKDKNKDSSPSDKVDDTTDPASETGGTLLYAAKLKECHDSGRLYDRRTATETDAGRCHASATWPAAYKCDRDGIVKAFGSSAAIKTYMDKQEKDGFKIDQCGVNSNGTPIVSFVRHVEGDGLTVRVVEGE